MFRIHTFEFLKENLAYPEGAHWARFQDRFAFVEWEGDRVWMAVDGQAQVLFELGSGEGEPPLQIYIETVPGLGYGLSLATPSPRD